MCSRFWVGAPTLKPQQSAPRTLAIYYIINLSSSQTLGTSQNLDKNSLSNVDRSNFVKYVGGVGFDGHQPTDKRDSIYSSFSSQDRRFIRPHIVVTYCVPWYLILHLMCSNIPFLNFHSVFSFPEPSFFSHTFSSLYHRLLTHTHTHAHTRTFSRLHPEPSIRTHTLSCLLSEPRSWHSSSFLILSLWPGSYGKLLFLVRKPMTPLFPDLSHSMSSLLFSPDVRTVGRRRRGRPTRTAR